MNKSVKTIFVVIFTIAIAFGTLQAAKAADSKILIGLTNDARTENGLADLTENEKLTSAAYAKANDMLSNDYFAHTSPAGKTPWDFIKAVGYDYTYAGENLAIGYTDDEELHDAWMASPTHRANIVNTNFRQIGIAVVTGEYQGSQTTVVVQMFGTPAASATVITPNTAPTVQEPVVQSAETQTPSGDTPNVASQVQTFTIDQGKTSLTPSQIFAGEKVKFNIALTGKVKAVVVNIANQKIDLLESGTTSQDGNATTYAKEIALDKIGDWPATLTVTGDNGAQETINLGTLKVAEKTLTKDTNLSPNVKGFFNQYKISFIVLFTILLIGLAVLVINRYLPKEKHFA